MTLKLYNSLTRQKEDFIPEDPKRVTMYNCGPTVYSHAHIGNARAAVVADMLFRVLRHIYGEEHVVYARNITDVEDKIIAAAKEQGVEISEITEKYARIYNEDLAALNCLQPTHQPKATDNIGGMIAMIEKLLADGYAYESDGHVFFDVSKYDEYGKLSGNTLDALKKGDRVGEGEVARKKNEADFVLWKPPLDGVQWDAPFGAGRPGWHIECSAMAKEVLGETIDIHCGGVDLKFPHHENEIAQSQCAHGKPMARYWVHNNFLNMGKEKMSKSIGNIKLISELTEEWDGEVIRLALLKAHYRSELIWTDSLLRESKANLDDWYSKISMIPKPQPKLPKRFQNIFLDYVLDDINTAGAIFSMGELLRSIVVGEWRDSRMPLYFGNDSKISLELKIELSGYVYELAEILGILQNDPKDWTKGYMVKIETARIDVTTFPVTLTVKRKDGSIETDLKITMDALIKERNEARAEKNWKRSDEIRDQLAAEGIVLEDGAGTTTWRRE